ncbi:putative ribosomal protein S21e [Helianthus debilis subsp. tardiflorus]
MLGSYLACISRGKNEQRSVNKFTTNFIIIDTKKGNLTECGNVFLNRKSTYYCFCSWASSRLITSKDHASVQINVGHSDGNGLHTGQFSTLAFCGFVRA